MGLGYTCLILRIILLKIIHFANFPSYIVPRARDRPPWRLDVVIRYFIEYIALVCLVNSPYKQKFTSDLFKLLDLSYLFPFYLSNAKTNMTA